MRLGTSLLPALAFAMISTWSGAQAQVTDYEAPGNLAPTVVLGCIAVDKVVDTETPADLYPAMSECLKRSDYPKAVDLFAIAGVYARFDTLRVTDETAHDANTVLTMQAMSSPSDAQKSQFHEVLLATAKDPARLAAMCGRIRRLGPPNYKPTYMIQHGMGAFTGKPAQPPAAHFDAKAAWQQSLHDYLHCPAA